MKKSAMPFNRYRGFPRINLPIRTWPNRLIEVAPQWCSVDLRDGNQALIEPMDIATKRTLFDLLVRMGFEQIEVGFPAASKIEFDFIRGLIEEGAIPDDVVIQVLTPARPDLIRQTFQAVRGAKRVIVHLYMPTSRLQRSVVFGLDRMGVIGLVVLCVQLIRSLEEQNPETEWILEFSPESFTGTELDFALKICSAVINEWQPDENRKIIINLPATVELSTPNVYADMIEWMCRILPQRENVIVSLHPHNDRGTGVAAAELGLMAGGQRVEGTLFGNGERTGNVDIVTLALNLMSQGVDPCLDISDIVETARIVQLCTGMAIHPRHPYAGELTFTALSGSHQDAINKGLASRIEKGDEYWEVPYLPIDPRDIGRTYRGLILVNSQSGKGGVSYVMRQTHHLDLPRGILIDFSAAVQKHAEHIGGVVEDRDIGNFFRQEYVNVQTPLELIDFDIEQIDDGVRMIIVEILYEGGYHEITGIGNGPIDALIRAIRDFAGINMSVISYDEHSLSSGSDAEAVAYVSVHVSGHDPIWGVGIDTDSSRASLLAVASAVNRYHTLITH